MKFTGPLQIPITTISFLFLDTFSLSERYFSSMIIITHGLMVAETLQNKVLKPE